MCLAVCGVDIIAVPAAMHEPKPAALKSTGAPLSSAVTFMGDDPVHGTFGELVLLKPIHLLLLLIK